MICAGIYLYIYIYVYICTASVGQNLFIDADGDMCQLQFRNLFWFQPQLGTRVCVLTVHGHSARARNAANTTENGPDCRHQTKKKQVSGYFYLVS